MENETAVISENTATLEALALLKAKQEAAAQCTLLDEELGTLGVESVNLEAGHQSLISRLASAERMTRFEADRLIVLGKTSTPEYAQLGQLVADLTAQSLEIEQRQRGISSRVQAIEEEKRVVLRRSAEDFRDAAIVLIRGAETGLANILDGARDSLNNLETQIGRPLYQPDQLTAGEKTPEWTTLHRMYSGPGR